MPPSRDWTNWVSREGTTRPLPRVTSSRTAKCAHIKPTTIIAMVAVRSRRAVRGVRISAAARISLANAKSDRCIASAHGRQPAGMGVDWLHAGAAGGSLRLRSLVAGLEHREDLVARAVRHQAAS